MIICAQCGHANRLGHIFCTNCRSRLNLNQISEEDLSAASPAGGRRRWRLGLLLVAALILAAGLAFWPWPLVAERGTGADQQQARRKIAQLEQGTRGRPQVFSEAELNASLAAALPRLRQRETFRVSAVQVQIRPNALVLAVSAIWRPAWIGDRPPLRMTYAITGIPQWEQAGRRFVVQRGMLGHLFLPGPMGLLIAPIIKRCFQELQSAYPAAHTIRHLELEGGRLTVYGVR